MMLIIRTFSPFYFDLLNEILAMASGGPKLTPMQREQMLVTVAQLEDKGYSSYAIADRVGVSRQMVDNYLKMIRKRFAEQQLESHEHYVKQKMRQFGKVRVEAWTQWENSKSSEAGPEPRYLETILKALAEEAKILGLHETKIKVDMTQSIDWDSFLSPFRSGNRDNVIDQERIEAICDESQPPITNGESHTNGTHDGLNGHNRHGGLNGNHHAE